MTESVPVRVMLVDDSALVRGLLRKIVQKDPALDIISTCGDGETALRDYKTLKPDIVLMDVEMPHMDGLTALQKMLAFDPAAKVIMCSSLTQEGAETTYKALDIGALDCLAKPSSTDIDRSAMFEENLRMMLKSIGRSDKAAAKSDVKIAQAPQPRSEQEPPSEKPAFVSQRRPAVTDTTATHPAVPGGLLPLPGSFNPRFPVALAIGSSTGGPNALPEFFKDLDKKIMLPIFITQHMPAGFEKCLADVIHKKSGFTVHIAEEGMRVEPGHIYIARSGMHMGVTPGAGKKITLIDAPPVNFCKPSINVMLESLKESYRGHLLVALFTGMGEDGKDACAALHAEDRQNIVVVQDQESSVVWGIPGAVAKAGLAHKILPLSQMGGAVNALMRRDLSKI